MNDTQKAARSALFSLKEATLKVFCEAEEQGDGYIQPLEIRKRLGIPKAEEPGDYANTLIFGILYYLLLRVWRIELSKVQPLDVSLCVACEKS